MTTYRLPVFRDRPTAALIVICLSVFVISVDATIVNVALPTLSRELDADTAQLQWIVDAYTLVMAGLLLSAGSLSDRYGRRGWLSSGLALFALTSAVAAQVNTADGLIAARAAMGVGAAVIFPTTLALITNIFTDPVARAKAIGLWAAMVGVGVAAGPITGGWLLEHFAWGSIFWVNVPIALAAIIGGWLVVPTSRDPATPTVDMGGLILSALGVTALVYTVIEAPTWGWSSAHTIVGFAAAGVVLIAFAAWERRRAHPMLDVSVFANRRFSGGSLAVTSGFLTLFGFIFVITQYFQFIKSYSAFETGVRLLPVAVSIALGSALGPRIVERIGTTVVVSGGLAMFAAGLGWASTADAATPYLVIAMQMVLLGGGLGPDDRACNGGDHGLAVRGQGGDRLGGQRHHPGTRRHPRRCDRRKRVRLDLLGPARGKLCHRGIARRGAGHDGEVDGGRAEGHRRTAWRQDGRCARCRERRVPSRASDRNAGVRRHRTGCRYRGSSAAARAGAVAGERGA